MVNQEPAIRRRYLHAISYQTSDLSDDFSLQLQSVTLIYGNPSGSICVSPVDAKLREIPNPFCETQCDRRKRDELTEAGVCDQAKSASDQLPVRCVGAWAYEKIHYLMRYFDIFATGMHHKWKTGLNYIEVCSGPGRCIRRDNGTEFDGTALAILNSKAAGFLTSALFIDNNPTAVSALQQRIAALGKTSVAKAAIGDYSDPHSIDALCQNLQANALTLAFIDPTDCSVPFSTLAILKKRFAKLDLIINVAVGTDASRNLIQCFTNPGYAQATHKYASFLGSNDFFTDPENRRLAELGRVEDLRAGFLETYTTSLKTLGYRHFAYDTKVRAYYNLLYASAHDRGIDFWNKAANVQPSGQKRFDF